MILTYSTLFRTETDSQVIATLVRKGWTEARMDVVLCPADDPRVVDGYPVGYPESATPLAVGATAIGTEMTQTALEALRTSLAAALDAYNNRPQPYRVSSDTIWNRVKDQIGLTNAAAVLAGMTPEQKVDWDNNTWYWSTNPAVRAMITQIQLDPEVILARDPYLSW